LLLAISVGVGGFFGAILRYYLSSYFNSSLHLINIPIGTLSVNIIGSFVMGFLFALFRDIEISEPIKLFLTTGLLGALTTYSTFALETLLLLESGNISTALFSVTLNIFGTVFAVWVGTLIYATFS